MLWFNNLLLVKKLLLSFSVILVLSLLLGLFSILQLGKVNDVAKDFSDNWLPSVNQLLEIRGELMEFRVAELQHINSTDEAEMVAQEKAMAQYLGELREHETAYKIVMNEEDEKKTYAEFVTVLDAYLNENKKIITLSRANDDQAATTLSKGESHKLFEQAKAIIEKLVKANVDGGVVSREKGQQGYQQGLTAIVFFLALSAVLSVLLAIFTARSISVPLLEAVEVAQHIADGDLTVKVEPRSRDETGMLMQSLKDMTVSLVNIVSQVREGTEQISSASNEIASGNSDLSSRTEQQASSLEETASSMEELTSTVRQNAENARHGNQLAEQAASIAGKGGDVVAQVVTTMGSINASSKKIVDIISVIDGIAFQTNILALNAAVEAARAGEQGRGFAVVASEVRNLAQRSAAAAKEIKELIGASVDKVDAGSKLVDQAGMTMDEVVNSIGRVNAIMSEIMAASSEQITGIEQVNTAVVEIDNGTQQNAALVEQAAAAAEAMRQQASKLAELVSVFKLHPSEARAHRAASVNTNRNQSQNKPTLNAPRLRA
jgi:methyl-accepting chemotaxis protein